MLLRRRIRHSVRMPSRWSATGGIDSLPRQLGIRRSGRKTGLSESTTLRPAGLASDVQEHVDCTACANCCRYSVVSVNGSEIENIAGHLGTTSEAVARLYTVPDPDAPALRTLRNSGAGCVFLDGNLCMIYEA
jgi:hypothetical protein